MKELSIEEKAQRYDEAIKRANELLYVSDKESLQCKTIENIFPELKESEDEKIKRVIRGWIYTRPSSFFDNGISKEEMLAWLEKQGEPIEINLTEFDTRLQALIGKFDSLPKEELIRNLSFWLNVVRNDGTYKSDEKQGEQKPATKSEINQNLQNNSFRRMFESVNKNDISHEPKFHEGDWVVYNNDICQIVKREEGCNKLVTVFGIEKELVNERNLSTARLWTIQDAKDGDVLVTGNKNIFIFKSISDCTIYDYCGLYNGKFMELSGTVNSPKAVQLPMDYVPATKEQRDTLLKAMADAGYTFDFESKELKKWVKK